MPAVLTPKAKELIAEIQEEVAMPTPTNGQPEPALEVEATPEIMPEPMPNAPAPPEPQTIVVEAQPPAGKKKAVSRSGQTKVPSANVVVNQVIGSAVSFRISKNNNGTMAYIGEYTLDDLRPSGNDMERFIQENLIDRHGDGKFFVQAKNGQGGVAREREYTVLSPYRPAAGGVNPTQGAAEGKLLDLLSSQLRTMHEEARNKPQPDPIAQMRAMQELMGPKQDSSGMMMAMMMMQQQSSGPDPRLAVLEMQLAEAQRRAAEPPPLPPPPLPPPPPPDNTLRDLIPFLTREQPSVVDQMLKALPLIQPMISNMFGGRNDMAAEMQKLQLDHLKEKISELSMPHNPLDDLAGQIEAVRNLGSVLGGAPAESAVKYFFENFGTNMEALGSAAKAIRGEENQARLGPGSGEAPAALPAPAAPAAPAEGHPLPPDFHTAMEAVNNADDDKERLMLMLAALQILHQQSEHYRSIPTKMMTQVRMNLPDQFFKSVEMFMTDCENEGLIGPEAAAAVVRAAKTNFSEIRKMMQAAEEATGGNEEKNETQA